MTTKTPLRKPWAAQEQVQPCRGAVKGTVTEWGFENTNAWIRYGTAMTGAQFRGVPS
jgi:hypothetical protein